MLPISDTQQGIYVRVGSPIRQTGRPAAFVQAQSRHMRASAERPQRHMPAHVTCGLEHEPAALAGSGLAELS